MVIYIRARLNINLHWLNWLQTCIWYMCLEHQRKISWKSAEATGLLQCSSPLPWFTVIPMSHRKPQILSVLT